MKSKTPKTKIEDDPPLLVSVPEFARRENQPIHRIREAVRLGQLESVTLGKSRYVKFASARKTIGAA